MIDDAAVTRAEQIPGWMSRGELRWLAEQATQASRIIEIGSWKGRSTFALCAHTPGHVWAIDWWQGQRDAPEAGPSVEIARRGGDAIFAEFLANMRPWLDAGRLTVLRMTSLEAVATFRRHPDWGPLFDFVFIDGAHEYEAVKADVAAYRPLVRLGGLLAGHDYSPRHHPGVKRAVDEAVGKVSVVGDIWAWRAPARPSGAA